jgi:hypothetical protein
VATDRVDMDDANNVLYSTPGAPALFGSVTWEILSLFKTLKFAYT